MISLYRLKGCFLNQEKQWRMSWFILIVLCYHVLLPVLVTIYNTTLRSSNRTKTCSRLKKFKKITCRLFLIDTKWARVDKVREWMDLTRSIIAMYQLMSLMDGWWIPTQIDFSSMERSNLIWRWLPKLLKRIMVVMQLIAQLLLNMVVLVVYQCWN